MRKLLVAGLAAMAAVLLMAAGPAKDEAPPPLVVDILNDDKEAFDVVEAAKNKPLIVFFVADITDESNQQAAMALEQGYREARYQTDLQIAVVVIGDDEVRERLTEQLQANRVQVPVAVLAEDAEGLAPWALGDDTKNMVVFVRRSGKVYRVEENVDVEEDADRLRSYAEMLLY